jgi:tRNA threonylcarbamoyladenosine modification (KEOPS) complex  Pcc1 subunit
MTPTRHFLATVSTGQAKSRVTLKVRATDVAGNRSAVRTLRLRFA